jgi:hypothetical protein
MGWAVVEVKAVSDTGLMRLVGCCLCMD